MSEAGKIEGQQGVVQKSVDDTLLNLASLLVNPLSEYGIDLFSRDDILDDIKQFFSGEGIAITKASVENYIKWLIANRDKFEIIKRLKNDFGVDLYVSNNGVKSLKSTLEQLDRFLSNVFGDKKPSKDDVDILFSRYENFQKGLRVYSYLPPAEEAPSSLTDQDKQSMRERASSLIPFGLDFFSESDSDEVIISRIYGFMRSMGVEEVESFDKFVSFLKNLKSGNADEQAEALKLLFQAKVDSKESPSFITAAWKKGSEVTNLELLGEKISQGYNLLVFQKEDKSNVYFWISSGGEISALTKDEKDILEKSSLTPLLQKGIFTRENDPLSSYISIKKAGLETVLAYQALINGVKPETIRGLQTLKTEGHTIKEIMKQLEELAKKVSDSVDVANRAATPAKEAIEAYQKANKELNEIFSQRGRIDGRQFASKLAESTRIRREALEKRDKAIEAENRAKGNQKGYLKEIENLCERLGVEKEELEDNKLLGFLQALDDSDSFAADVDLLSVANRVYGLGKKSGISVDESGSLVAVVDRDVFAAILPQKTSASDKLKKAERDGMKGVSLSNPQILKDFPIILIKATLLGVEGDPYLDRVDLSTERLSSQELGCVADLFSPKYSVSSLAFSDDEGLNQNLADNLIQEQIRNAPDEKTKKIFVKLLACLKSDDKTSFSADELNLLRDFLIALIKDDKDSDATHNPLLGNRGKEIWTTLYDKVFTDTGFSFRVVCGRGGLSAEDRERLLVFTEDYPTFEFTTFDPEENDTIEIIRVKSILRTIAKQLSFYVGKDKVELPKSLDDVRGVIGGIVSALDGVMQQIRDAGKITQEIELPQGVEEHLWSLYVWDHLDEPVRESYREVVERLRVYKNDFDQAVKEIEAKSKEIEKKSEELEAAEKNNSGVPAKDKEKLRNELKSLKDDFKQLQDAAKEIKKLLQKKQDSLMEISWKNGLDGRISSENVGIILREAAEDGILAQLIPALPALMVDQDDMRLNSVRGIDSLSELEAFVLEKIGVDGWDSLIRDPGENIEISIAKKIVSILLSQKYFNKIRQGNSVLSVFSVLPLVNTARTAIMTTVGFASVGVDGWTEGSAPKDTVTFPPYFYNTILLKQLTTLTQTLQAEPNTNIAPYVHLLLIQLGIKDQFYFYDLIMSDGMGKVTFEEVKMLVEGLVKQINGFSQNTDILKLIEGKLPGYLRDGLWKELRGADPWGAIFKPEGDSKTGFELYLSDKFGEKVFELIKLCFSILEAESDFLSPSLKTTSGGHIGAQEIDRSLKNGIVFRPNPSQGFIARSIDTAVDIYSTPEVGSLVLGSASEVLRSGLDATTGFISGSIDTAVDIYSTPEVGSLALGSASEVLDAIPSFWDGVKFAGNFFYGMTDTALTFWSMPPTFFQLGAQYTKDIVEGILEVKRTGDWSKLLEAGKSYVGLVGGVITWMTYPVEYFEEGMQMWREANAAEEEGNDDEASKLRARALGSFLAMAGFSLQVLRMHLYRVNEIRNFLMCRPTMLREPGGIFAWPLRATEELLLRPARFGIDLAWSPARRQYGEGWFWGSLRSGLEGFDSGIEGISSSRAGVSRWFGDKFSFNPSSKNRTSMQWLGGAKTLVWDWYYKDFVSLEAQSSYLSLGNRFSVSGFNAGEYMELMRMLDTASLELDGLSIKDRMKKASFMKSHNIKPMDISLSQGTLLTLEQGPDGKFVYVDGDPLVFANRDKNLRKNLPKTVTVPIDGIDGATQEMPVGEIKVVAGNTTEIRIYRGALEVEYASLIVGEDLLKTDRPVDFSAPIGRLGKAMGSISSIPDPAPPEPIYTPDERVEKVRNVRERVKTIDLIWGRYDNKEITRADLEGAMREGLKTVSFEGLSLEDQIRLMDETEVEIKGGTYKLAEVRLAWVRTLFKEIKGITLSTPQIEAILLMHNRISAQIQTGQGKTFIRCALDVLDHVFGRKLFSLTHTDLTAEADFKSNIEIYRAAGMKVKFVRHTDAGLATTFRDNDVIYTSVNDLAFIDLNGLVSPEKVVDIPWEEGLFRVDEFDFIYVDEGLTPYVMSGGEKEKAQVKAWRKANETAKKLIKLNKAGRSIFSIRNGEGAVLNPEAVSQRLFLDEKGNTVSWNELSLAQRKRISQCLVAYKMKPGEGYEINQLTKDIVLLDEKTGQAKYGSQYSDGLQQALQAKHEGKITGTRITPENSTIAQVMARTLVRRIRNMVASSGTLDQISAVLDQMGIAYERVPTNIVTYKWQALTPEEKARVEEAARMGGNDAIEAVSQATLEKNLTAIKEEVDAKRGESVQIFDRTEPGFRDVQIITSSDSTGSAISRAVLRLKGAGIIATKFIQHEPVMNFVAEVSAGKAPNLTLIREKKIETIFIQMEMDLERGRPIVVGADSPKLAEAIYGCLEGKSKKYISDPEILKRIEAVAARIRDAKRSGSHFGKVRVGLLAQGDEHKYLDIFERPLEENFDVLVTTLARRATDFKSEKPIILYLADQEVGSWGHWQKVGRVGRQGTEAILRIFTSPDSGLYGTRLCNFNFEAVSFDTSVLGEIRNRLSNVVDRAGNSVSLAGINEFSTFRDVFLLLNNVDISEIDGFAAWFFGEAQKAFDRELINMWKNGIKAENLLPQDIRNQLEDLRETFGSNGRKPGRSEFEKKSSAGDVYRSKIFNSVKRQCETVVEQEVEFLWGRLKGEGSSIIDLAHDRATLSAVIRTLAKKFNVKIVIDLPTAENFDLHGFASSLAREITGRLFDYKKMQLRNLSGVLGNAYVMFQEAAFEAGVELAAKYESRSKLVKTSESETDVRKIYEAEYREKIDNLLERFRSQIIEGTKKLRKIESVPVVGRYGIVRHRFKEEIRVDVGSLLHGVSTAPEPLRPSDPSPEPSETGEPRIVESRAPEPKIIAPHVREAAPAIEGFNIERELKASGLLSEDASTRDAFKGTTEEFQRAFLDRVERRAFKIEFKEYISFAGLEESALRAIVGNTSSRLVFYGGVNDYHEPVIYCADFSRRNVSESIINLGPNGFVRREELTLPTPVPSPTSSLAPSPRPQIVFTGESFDQGSEITAGKLLKQKGVTAVHIMEGTGRIDANEFVTLTKKIPKALNGSGQFVLFPRNVNGVQMSGIQIPSDCSVEFKNSSFYVVNSARDIIGQYKFVNGKLELLGGWETPQMLEEMLGHERAVAVVDARGELLRINGSGEVLIDDAARLGEPLEMQIVEEGGVRKAVLVEPAKKPVAASGGGRSDGSRVSINLRSKNAATKVASLLDPKAVYPRPLVEGESFYGTFSFVDDETARFDYAKGMVADLVDADISRLVVIDGMILEPDDISQPGFGSKSKILEAKAKEAANQEGVTIVVGSGEDGVVEAKVVGSTGVSDDDNQTNRNKGDKEVEVEARKESVIIRDKASGRVELKISVEEWKAMESLGRRLGLTPEQIARTYVKSTDKAFQESAAETVEEKLTVENIIKFLQTSEGQEFIRKNAPTLANRLKSGVPSLILEVIALLGAEQLAHIVGIDAQRDPMRHFAFVLGVTHVFSSNVSRPIIHRLATGAPLLQLKVAEKSGAALKTVKSGGEIFGVFKPEGEIVLEMENKRLGEIISKNLFNKKGLWNATKKVFTFPIKFPFEMVKGMGPGLYWAFLTDQMLVNSGLISEDSEYRHWGGFLGFFTPSVASMLSPTFGQGLSLATDKFEDAMIRINLQIMLKGEAAGLAEGLGTKALMWGGRANAAAGAMFATGFAFELVTMASTSSYDTYVANRAFDEDLMQICRRNEVKPYDFFKSPAYWVTMFKPLAPSFVSVRGASPENKDKIKELDRHMSQEMQDEIRGYFRERLLTEYSDGIESVDLSFTSEDAKWKYIEGQWLVDDFESRSAGRKASYQPSRKDKIAEAYRNETKEEGKYMQPVLDENGKEHHWTADMIAWDMNKNGLSGVKPEEIEEIMEMQKNRAIQDSIAFLHFIDLPVNDPIRSLFDRQGKLIKGKEREFIKWVFGEDKTEKDVVAARKSIVKIQGLIKDINSYIETNGTLEGFKTVSLKDEYYFAALSQFLQLVRQEFQANPEDENVIKAARAIEARIQELHLSWVNADSGQKKLICKELLALGDAFGASILMAADQKQK